MYLCVCACVHVCMCVCVCVCACVCMVDRHRCGMHFAFSMSDNTLIRVQVGMHESCHCESSIPLSTQSQTYPIEEGEEGGLPTGKGEEGGLPTGKGEEGGLPTGKGEEGGLPTGKGEEGGLPTGKGEEGGLTYKGLLNPIRRKLNIQFFKTVQ